MGQIPFRHGLSVAQEYDSPVVIAPSSPRPIEPWILDDHNGWRSTDAVQPVIENSEWSILRPLEVAEQQLGDEAQPSQIRVACWPFTEFVSVVVDDTPDHFERVISVPLFDQEIRAAKSNKEPPVAVRVNGDREKD
ncbi:MAG: hypothetical protein VYC34_09610, partial [Planctomycetota bacterium]|nr:hypothetical protein [Planctomycetota bacterium]